MYMELESYNSNVYFIIKNISSQHKRITVFGAPIDYLASRNLLSLPGITEADIRTSLLKGELYRKIKNLDITIVNSNIDLIQFSSEQQEFLSNAGITIGVTVTNSGSFSADSLSNGTITLPSLSFATDKDVGMYKLGDNRIGWAVGNSLLGLEMGNHTIENLEQIPSTVRYTTKINPLPIAGVNESAGIYIKLDHDINNQHKTGIYGEITNNQLDTWGSFIKGIHFGAGDFCFVGQFTSGGAAYEASSFADGTKGFISTIQYDGYANSTLFNALWEHPTVPNYGMFFAAESPGHSLTIQKYDTTSDGQAQIRLVENDFGRHRFRLLNNGGIICESLASTSGITKYNSPELRVRGSYWNGSSNIDLDGLVKLVVENSTGPIYGMYMYAGPTSGEFLSCIFRPGALDMQLNTISNIQNLDAYNNAITLRTDAGSTVLTQLDPTISDGETALLLRRNVSSAFSLVRVKFGATGSGPGGTGRALYIDD